MSKKMIECLACHGRGWFVTSIGSINECAKCGTAGRIPDRRKPSEIEDALRAEVERLNGRFDTANQVIAHRENECAMLRAEVAALQAKRICHCGATVEEIVIGGVTYRTNASSTNAKLMAEVERLQAELAKYTEPLTKDQCSETLRISLAPFIGPATLRVLDAAIRRVRGAE